MVAHVGDFGFARFVETSYHTSSSTGIRGTIGYTAPEYGVGSMMRSSGDVYSYGILLLEVMTGKMPNDGIFEEGLSLHKFASMALPNHAMDVIDVNILNVYQEDKISMQNNEAYTKKVEECLTSIIKIGVVCSVESPTLRMDMKTVVHELQHIALTLQNN
ncbi:hypothetical protein QVD17_31346 [Tagetes erecta]|uniref:Protein kinase domain-containing protein n=1 Tax=Tagetes erecta TaxID=13708 RepID=A0AAD8NP86_TARER|nr:hypothetical protein QVD17_31346 [Tagetes erecta]